MKEPEGDVGTKGRRDEGTKGQDEARGVESRGAGWSTPDQDGATGTREPSGASGLPGHGRKEGARSHGGADGQRAEAESGPQRLGTGGWRRSREKLSPWRCWRMAVFKGIMLPWQPTTAQLNPAHISIFCYFEKVLIQSIFFTLF